MQRTIYGAGISILQQDADFAISYAENLPEHCFSSDNESETIIGKSDHHLFGDTDGARLRTVKEQVLKTGDPATTEVECMTPDGNRVYELKIERMDAGDSFNILSIISEVTDTRHRERLLKSLLRELSHRSKNLLAIIQGIATQTARHTISLDYFLVKFRGRLQSLSKSQDLITDSSWRGAYLFDLAAQQLEPYWPETAYPMRIQGINAHLSPNAAVHLGLALHELIVNSATHGAISMGATTIMIECRETMINDHKAIELIWTESMASSLSGSELEDRSFSRTVLERVVPTSMNGNARLDMTPNRIEYQLVIPDTEFEALKQSRG